MAASASASASFSCRGSRFLGDAAFRSPSSSTGSRVRFGSPRVAAEYTTAERPLRYASLKRSQSASSLYDVLGITAGATRQEIKAAYRRLARVCHPDVRKDASSEAEFMRIHAAYATLSDPEKRADYDRIYRLHAPIRAAASSSFSGYSRRTWETDQCW